MPESCAFARGGAAQIISATATAAINQVLAHSFMLDSPLRASRVCNPNFLWKNHPPGISGDGLRLRLIIFPTAPDSNPVSHSLGGALSVSNTGEGFFIIRN